jgi:hypothetical protein
MPYRQRRRGSSCWAALAHQGYEEVSITLRIINGPVRVFMIAQPINRVAINVAGPWRPTHHRGRLKERATLVGALTADQQRAALLRCIGHMLLDFCHRLLVDERPHVPFFDGGSERSLGARRSCAGMGNLYERATSMRRLLWRKCWLNKVCSYCGVLCNGTASEPIA